FCLFKAVRLFGTPLEAATAAIMVTVSTYGVRYATETKHYVFEAAASAAVFYAAALVSKSPKHSGYLVLLLATALVGYAFSFTLLPVVAACSIGIVMTVLWREWSVERATMTHAKRFSVSALALFAWSYRSLFLVCMAACIAGLCFHVCYTRPATVFQFAANQDRYGHFSASAGAALVSLAGHLYSVLAPIRRGLVFADTPPAYSLTRLFIAVLFAAFCLALRRDPFIPISAAALYAIMIFLNLWGFFPFVWGRHFYFVLPIISGMLVSGTGEGLSHLQKLAGSRLSRLAPISFTLLSVLYVVGGIATFKSLKVEEVSPLLRRIDATSPKTPIWVYYGAQPAMGILAPPGLVQLGLVDPRSSPVD